ncbi:methylglyoxal synthase [Solibacillus sp. FSL K6-1523]|uniref:methylglyoxal synthase n=1 Tax=Solibacillus sp. FSL K6-1523 TaxID=2921471 RepID=UPI0030F7D795
MKIALIAHDQKKDNLIQFAIAYRDILAQHQLYATGTTGTMIHDETGLPITLFRSGPLGGDQQIGAMIANDEMDMVFFFRDPLTAQPHEPDVMALVRLCDLYHIPLATNMGTAEIILKGLQEGFVDWRKLQERRQ